MDSHKELATKALVFQVISLRGSFECVIRFFVNKIESLFLSPIVKTAILKLKDVGVNVQVVTCYGPSTKSCALKHLGCSFPQTPY